MAAKKQAAVLEPAEIVMPKIMEVAAFIEEQRKAGIDEALALVKALEIRKPADAEFAGNALNEVSKHLDTLDKKRKKWVEVPKGIAKDIDQTFKPLLDKLKEAKDMLKAKIGAWHIEQEFARQRALKAASQAAQAGDTEATDRAIVVAATHEVGKLAGVNSCKTEWTGEVVDAAQIPREYLMPDLAKLQAVTKAHEGDVQIPGWRTFPVANVKASCK